MEDKKDKNYKKCVFCNEKPVDKNKEHIIPQWLIKHTGNQSRNIRFGPFYNPNVSNGEPYKVYSFNNLVFPACYVCNFEFADFEANAKKVILKILSDGTLNKEDTNILLDWFDKVRVGLWQGITILNKDHFELNPKFGIKKRMGYKDRFLAIMKTTSAKKGINFFGQDTMAFQFSPSVFGLRINNYFFLNVSSDELISKLIGNDYFEVTNTRVTYDSGTLHIGDGKIKHKELKRLFSYIKMPSRIVFQGINSIYETEEDDIENSVFRQSKSDIYTDGLFSNYVKITENTVIDLSKLLHSNNPMFDEYDLADTLAILVRKYQNQLIENLLIKQYIIENEAFSDMLRKMFESNKIDIETLAMRKFIAEK